MKQYYLFIWDKSTIFVTQLKRKEVIMLDKLLDALRTYSMPYKTSSAFRMMLQYMIDNCKDEKKIIRIIVTELKEASELDMIFNEEEIEEIEKIIA